MEDYKSNSDKSRQEQKSEKKVEAVITGTAKTRKKGDMQKFADVFIAEDAKLQPVLLLDSVRLSQRNTLIQARIPFIIPEKQLYIPQRKPGANLPHDEQTARKELHAISGNITGTFTTF